MFEDVGFIYPGAERWAVRHLSFTLKAGEVVALVGENGAGKTTLVKLLTRSTTLTRAASCSTGRDLRDYDLEDLRGSMGVIFQDFRALQFQRRRQYRGGPNLRAARPGPHRARRPAQPSRRGDPAPAERLSPAHRQALQERRRTVGRRMAEDRHRAGLYARGRGADPSTSRRRRSTRAPSSRCSSASRSSARARRRC